MKKALLLIILFLNFNIYSQENKTVTLTVSGTGKTLEEAKTNALRSAIEQAFGAFISSKTEILNNQIVADQISSVSNGNIQSFEILNLAQFPAGSWGVTLKVLVSVSKLQSFVQSKGVEIQIKGGLFAMNIKQQLLNEQGEIKAISEMVGLLHEPMQTAFDYSIKSGEPKSLDAESKNWEIPLIVNATTNKNIDFCAEYCIKTLAALSLTNDEVESYRTLNKTVLPVIINYNDKEQIFYLRKHFSINVLNTLISNWNFYVGNFTVKTGIVNVERDNNGKLHAFNKSSLRDKNTTRFEFLTSGIVAGTFSWNDKKTLTQIEQMIGYSVSSAGVSSQFKHGGFVVYEKNGHGLVSLICNIENLSWDKAEIECNQLLFNSYKDWRLPYIEELKKIYFNLKLKGIGNFVEYFDRNELKYLSSTISKDNQIFKDNVNVKTMKMDEYNEIQDFPKMEGTKWQKFGIRPVRKF